MGFIFDPLGDLRDAFEKFARGLLALFSAMLGEPAVPHTKSAWDLIFAMSMSLALFIAIPVSALVVVIALLFKHRLVSVLHSIVVFVMLSAFNTGWFGAWLFLIVLGDQVANAAGFYNPTQDIQIPAFDDVIGAIFGSLTIASWGGALMLILKLYVAFDYVVLLLGPVSFAMSPLGRRSQAFFEWLASIGFVALVLGRAVARFCVDVGRFLMDHLPGGTNWFEACCYIAVIFIVAILVQWGIIMAVHQGMQRVMGKLTGRTTSKVSGKVESTNKRRQPVDVKSIGAAHVAALNPVARPSLAKQGVEKAVAAGKHVAADQVRRKAVKHVLLKTAGGTTPVGAAVVAANTAYEARKAVRATSAQAGFAAAQKAYQTRKANAARPHDTDWKEESHEG